MMRENPIGPLDREALSLKSHPPERRRSNNSITLSAVGCGACCCCCCLHSVGSLFGSIAASVPLRRSVEPRRSAAVVYWVVFFLTLVSAGLGLRLKDSNIRWEDGLLLLALGLPLVQLAASVVSFFVIVLAPYFRPSKPYLWSLARITLFSFLGCVLGIVVMIGLSFVLR